MLFFGFSLLLNFFQVEAAGVPNPVIVAIDVLSRSHAEKVRDRFDSPNPKIYLSERQYSLQDFLVNPKVKSLYYEKITGACFNEKPWVVRRGVGTRLAVVQVEKGASYQVTSSKDMAYISVPYHKTTHFFDADEADFVFYDDLKDEGTILEGLERHQKTVFKVQLEGIERIKALTKPKKYSDLAPYKLVVPEFRELDKRKIFGGVEWTYNNYVKVLYMHKKGDFMTYLKDILKEDLEERSIIYVRETPIWLHKQGNLCLPDEPFAVLYKDTPHPFLGYGALREDKLDRPIIITKLTERKINFVEVDLGVVERIAMAGFGKSLTIMIRKGIEGRKAEEEALKRLLHL